VPDATFRVELVCIVDSVDTGLLVARTERLNLMLPASPVFHWAKRAFERVYLRRYR
jgi:sulfide:quinone oxidoreductase